MPPGNASSRVDPFAIQMPERNLELPPLRWNRSVSRGSLLFNLLPGPRVRLVFCNRSFVRPLFEAETENIVCRSGRRYEPQLFADLDGASPMGA
jgi:hypothetical protein